MDGLKTLRALARSAGIKTVTTGVSEALLAPFAKDANLIKAVDNAVKSHAVLSKKYPEIFKMDEEKALVEVQKGFKQFYDATAVNPYIPIGASGNWMVTHTGAAIYVTDGYGMLGQGHNPEAVMEAISAPQAMANIMTPSFSQKAFTDALRKEIGHTRGGVFPYEAYQCLNSGSESVTLAMRIADVHSKRVTAAGGAAAGLKPCIVSFKGSFHGRTERPGHASDSTRATYNKYLKSFEAKDSEYPTFTVEPNDISDLKRVFAEARAKGYHPEIFLIEPVMGEGNPGQAVTREFYDAARAITIEYDTFLLVDSIQAGMRTRGTLSILDFPGFSDAAAPDFETYSKALNGGQYPLSVLALGSRSAASYERGLYGNTMTTNPRALDVATAVLSQMTPELRKNIVEMGEYFKAQLATLEKTHSDVVEKTTGAGMLLASHLKPEWKAYGHPLSLEVLARRNGLGVIHGGKNALRYTPCFTMTEQEANLAVAIVDKSIVEMRELRDKGAYNN